MKDGWHLLLGIGLALIGSCSAFAGEVQVYTDRAIRPALVECLNNAQKSLDIEMYTLTDAEVIAALERAEERGVEVRVILDPNQKGNYRHVEHLTGQGAEVKWFPVERPALMHRKLAIVDGKQILAGSVNWTANGLMKNEEVFFVIDDAAVARQLAETFDTDWYHSWTGRESTY